MINLQWKLTKVRLGLVLRRNLVGASVVLLSALCAHGCVSPRVEGDAEDLSDEDLKLKPNWHDFLGHVSPDRPLYNALVNGPAKRSVPAPIETPELYEGGVYGYVGSAKAFVARRRTIPDYNRLYWVMVKVLSEKYSCFMTAKQNRGDETWVQCRDGRQVVFWRDQSSRWIQFQARQYDQEGYEIAVRKHQIVRIGNLASAIGPIEGQKAN
jgi:hypothetical protein